MTVARKEEARNDGRKLRAIIYLQDEEYGEEGVDDWKIVLRPV
jgi:hypothetical protein